MLREKSFVDQLYNEKAKNDSNSKSLASLLNVLTKTVFGDANRFIFELIQNADDSPAVSDVSDVDVEFRLHKNYLVFSHNGKHFTEEDVQGISDVGSEFSGKTKDLSKTGYKGIGFKSVFGTCNKVYIISNNFTFKFDKNYSLWESRTDYPWQVIPLWFELSELDNEIQDSLDLKKINTIIEIEDKQKIEDEICKVFDDERLIIFLRHIRKITFYTGNVKKFELRSQRLTNGIKELYINQDLRSSWLCKEFIITVPQSTKESIITLDSALCPKKLKEATCTSLTFAALIKNEEIQKLTNDIIFCYLPTKVRHGFNFLINGDFITNAERTQILDNAWNNFIFEQIAFCNVEWLSEMAKSAKYRYQFPILIKKWFGGANIAETQQAYNNGLTKALEKIAFIPVEDNKELLYKINAVVLDTVEFSKNFESQIVESYYSNEYKIVDMNIKHCNELICLKIRTFTFDDLCKFIETQSFIALMLSDWHKYKSFIQYLFLMSSTNTNWMSELSKLSFLVDNRNMFSRADELYFPNREDIKNISDVVDILYLNLNFWDIVKGDENFREWLTKLGVKMPYDIEIFRSSVVKIFDRINIDNAIPISRFIFMLFQSGQLNDNDYNKLKKMKLITINKNFVLPKDCYLSDIYNPSLKLQSKFKKGNFVSDEYILVSDDVNHWRNFFVRLGVGEKIKFEGEERIERTAAESKYPVIKSYLNYIDGEGKFYPSITRPYICSKQHGFNNLIVIPYIEYCEDDFLFALELWKLITENLKKIETYCLTTKYYTRVGDNQVESFFQYYVRTTACIPGNDGKCYKSVNLYSKNLKDIVNNQFPIINESIQLNKEQEVFLGLKRLLSINDCLVLLNLLCVKPVNKDTGRITNSIYKQIEENLALGNNEIDKGVLQGLKMLATDDTFQNVNELYCFNIKNLLMPASSKFLKLPDSIKDKEKMSLLFGIRVINNEDLEFEARNTITEDELLINIKTKAKFFAVLIAKINAKDIQEVFEEVYRNLSIVSFYSANNLSLVYYNQEKQVIYRECIESWFCPKKKSLYYTGIWSSPLTLYSLSDSLCRFLGLEGKDREVSLLLQLSNEEIEKWFLSKGYEIIDLGIPKDESNNIFKTENDFPHQMNDCGDRELEIESIFLNDQLSTCDGQEDSCIKTSDICKQDYNRIELLDKSEDSSEKKSSIYNQGSHIKRLLSYVGYEAVLNNNESKIVSRPNIIQKANSLISNYERNHNRELVADLDAQNEQFLISKNMDEDSIERYIKPFWFMGEWNYYDVAILTAEEMKFAREKAEKFWIYVIEFIDDENSNHLYCIQNPFDKITKYAFDQGWRNTAEIENGIECFREGRRISHNIHGMGRIVRVIKKGEALVLEIDFENSKRRVPLNITQMQVLEE